MVCTFSINLMSGVISSYVRYCDDGLHLVIDRHGCPIHLAHTRCAGHISYLIDAIRNSVTLSPNPPLSYVRRSTSPRYARWPNCRRHACLDRLSPPAAPFKHRFLAGQLSAPDCTRRRHPFAPSTPHHGPRPLR